MILNAVVVFGMVYGGILTNFGVLGVFLSRVLMVWVLYLVLFSACSWLGFLILLFCDLVFRMRLVLGWIDWFGIGGIYMELVILGVLSRWLFRNFGKWVLVLILACSGVKLGCFGIFGNSPFG